MSIGISSVRAKSHFECHQVLHGYNDGHQLLASSLALPRSVRTRMLLLTDLSGPSVVKGFESYLTGFPLSHEGLYAFSRTWYAEEMPRPGCVWTHTLLLSDEMLASLNSLSALTHLFSRPAEKDIAGDFAAYKPPIAVDVELKAHSIAVEGIEEQVRRLIAAFYGRPKANVVAGARSAVDLEHVVLAIWSQQWPRLRRSFTFCTGNLGRRSSTDVRFDLQIVPETQVRQFRRDAHSNVIIAEETANGDRKRTDWVDATLNDMISSSHNRLREFLWEFGRDHQDGRAVFPALCGIYLLARTQSFEPEAVRNLVEFLSTSLPSPEEAYRLKESLLGYPGGSIGGQKRPLEEQLLVAKLLLSGFGRECLAPEIINPRARSLGLGRVDRARAVSLGDRLIEMMSKSVAEEFIQGLVEVLQPQDVFRPEVSEAFLSRVIAAHPRLAASPLAWKQPHDRQSAVIRGLIARGAETPELVVEVCKAALDAGSDALVGVKFGSEGNAKVEALVEWLAERADEHGEVMACRWNPVLIGQDNFLLHWLSTCPQPSPPVILACALALEPSVDVSTLDIAMWSRLPYFSGSAIHGLDALRGACFVLRKGLEASRPEAAMVVAHVFAWIYDAAERNALSAESWGVVSASLPGSWWQWDKCVRLIQGVVDKFASCSWPIEHFVLTFEEPKQLEGALGYAKWHWSARDYFLKVCRVFHGNELSVTPGQAEVLRLVC